MKIAACDFDGTLFRDGRVSVEDLAAIARWRSEGNAFGIVTGRGRHTLLRDVGRFAVPYDFLICNNGAMICDERGRDVYCAALPPGVRADILNHPGVRACTQCAFFAGTSVFTHAGKTAYWIVEEYVLPRLDPAEALLLPSLHQISLAYSDCAASRLWFEALVDVCGERAGVHFTSICVDVTAPGVSKASGLERLLRLRRWGEADRVRVIGDDRNDLPMIRHFGGYAVENAPQDVRVAASRVVRSVGEMLLSEM